MELRVLSYNLRFGGKGRERLLAEVLSSVPFDLVVLQEASRPDTVRRLAADLGIPHWGARPGRSLGFLSRVPLSGRRWHDRRGVRNGFLELELAAPPLAVLGVHLQPRMARWNERSRVRELSVLAGIIRSRPEADTPHLIVGDFNTVAPGERVPVHRMPAWIRSTIWISGGRIRTDAIQALLDKGYLDGFRAVHPSRPGWTFPTLAPQVRLDYLFLSPGFPGRLADCRVVRRPEAVVPASDHFPLLSTLSF
jgi:exodeoxyribonuclease-3